MQCRSWIWRAREAELFFTIDAHSLYNIICMHFSSSTHRRYGRRERGWKSTTIIHKRLSQWSTEQGKYTLFTFGWWFFLSDDSETPQSHFTGTEWIDRSSPVYSFYSLSDFLTDFSLFPIHLFPLHSSSDGWFWESNISRPHRHHTTTKREHHFDPGQICLGPSAKSTPRHATISHFAILPRFRGFFFPTLLFLFAQSLTRLAREAFTARHA